jgi:hypothetical protein
MAIELVVSANQDLVESANGRLGTFAASGASMRQRFDEGV